MIKNSNNTMFFGASPSVFEKAKALRESMTEAEIKLWEFLSKSKVMGLRFRAQHPINRFITDFYCHQIRLVIEIDGEIHNSEDNLEYDISRTFEIEKYGIKVIRFTNDEVLLNFNVVKKNIISYCNLRKTELKVPFRGFRGSYAKNKPNNE